MQINAKVKIYCVYIDKKKV